MQKLVSILIRFTVFAVVLAACDGGGRADEDRAVDSKKESAARPNVVLIISDDHDYEHLGFMGNRFVHTPTLDRLANSGAVFTTAHLSMSRCHPSLAALLSGRHPHQTGVYYNFGTKKLPPDNSLPNLLKDAGYATLLEGKYWEGEPREMGFTHGSNSANGFVRKNQTRLFDFVDGHAGKQPFFIWWAPKIPHTPHNPPKKYVDLYDWSKMPTPSYVKSNSDVKQTAVDVPVESIADDATDAGCRRVEDAAGILADAGSVAHDCCSFDDPGPAADPKQKRKRRAGGNRNARGGRTWRDREQLSYAMEAWLDDGVSQLVGKLKDAGEFDNTLFVFVIDNGWCNGLPSKGTPFEKGVRSPVFLSWPGRIRGGQRFAGLVHTLDLYPTILDYAGVEAPKSAEGRSLKPIVEGKSDKFAEALFGATYPAFATKSDQRPERDVYALYIRTPEWKYIYYLQDVTADRSGDYFRIQSIDCDFPARKAGDEDLYALDKDPYEQHNLASDPTQQKRMHELKQRCLKWWKQTGGKPLNQASRAP